MSYGQLHILLENNVIHSTSTYKLSKINNEVYIKIKLGQNVIHTIDSKHVDINYTNWMSIPYAETQAFWYSKTIQKAFETGINKAKRIGRL